jgi:hypothetical protein
MPNQLLNARWNYRRIAGWPLAALAVALLAGCGPEPKIRKYTVPKLAVSSSQPAAKPAAGKPQTILGAIVLAGPKAWFFKVMDDPDAVAKHREQVREFVRTVSFSKEGEPPSWQLPEGWKEKPGDGFRHATLEIAGAMPPLGLAVSSLDRGGTDDAEYVLQNVNRWRGQVGLPATTNEKLAKEVEQFTIGEFSCTWVEFTGTSGGGMGGPFAGGPFAGGPFAGGDLPQDHPPLDARAAAGPQRPAGAPQVSYDVPAGWKEVAGGSLRAASFEVADGDQKLNISVTPLAAEGPAGDIVQNVNRWRGQVGLPSLSPEEIATSLRKLEGQGIEWQVVELAGTSQSGEQQTILGAIGKTKTATWFVKATGPDALAKREKEHFDQFVGSLKVN